MERKTEVVSIRLTPTERARLDKLGGATAVVRRAISSDAMHFGQSVAMVPAFQTLTPGPGGAIVWHDGTVGPQWPVSATA